MGERERVKEKEREERGEMTPFVIMHTRCDVPENAVLYNLLTSRKRK